MILTITGAKIALIIVSAVLILVAGETILTSRSDR
jgi:hypothetical protein